MKVIIALCGRAGSGKDTFAKHLVDRGFSNVKFSSTLKLVIRSLFPSIDTQRHTDGDLKDVLCEDLGASPRELMQFIGTDLLQHCLAERFPKIGRTVFCVPTMNKLRSIDKAVVTDMRFLHEYEAMKDEAARHDGYLHVVRINRDSCRDDRHSSERELCDIPFDSVVLNNGTLSDLCASAEAFCKEVDWEVQRRSGQQKNFLLTVI